MSKARFLTEQTIYNLAVFALLYSIAAVPAYALMPEASTAWYLLLLAVPFFITQALRNAVKVLVLFILLHAGLVVIVFFAARGIFPKILATAFMVIVVGYSFGTRLKGGVPDFDAAMVVVGVVVITVAHIIAARMGYEPLPALLSAAAATMAACFLLYSHMTSLDYSIEVITLTSVQPVREIISMNNKSIAVFTLLVISAGAAARLVNLDSLVGAVGVGLLALLRFLFSLLPQRAQETAAPEPMAPPVPESMAPLMPLDDSEPALIWVILETIFRYAAIIVLAALVIGLIIFACVRIYRRFYQRGTSEGDIKEFVAPEFLKIEALAVNLLRLLPRSAPSNKVRRRFYKKVRRHMAGGIAIANTDAPWEMRQKILAGAKEDIATLTEEYERERYAGS
ncbi:MAG: hypothetical protein LBS62_06665 [Clostridiales bacterium]|jgi:hypothetical protein|nr:hypothetical protein [Clostridiales bacterium]